MRGAGERDRRAENGRIAAEPPLPKLVAQHHRRRRAGEVVLARERTAGGERRTKDAEIRFRDLLGRDALWHVAVRVAHGGVGVGGDVLERVVERTPKREVGRRHVEVVGHAAVLRLPELQQRVRVRERYGLEHHGVDDGEHGRARGDADGEHRDRRDGEQRLVAPCSQRLSQVVQQGHRYMPATTPLPAPSP